MIGKNIISLKWLSYKITELRDRQHASFFQQDQDHPQSHDIFIFIPGSHTTNSAINTQRSIVKSINLYIPGIIFPSENPYPVNLVSSFWKVTRPPVDDQTKQILCHAPSFALVDVSCFLKKQTIKRRERNRFLPFS